ncbi:fibronectin type III domain-containing protein [Tichowtungia aerotolerans]|uniref:Fibronectin type-III domain-containing protein n=1 Tax=Tichowtungia aerotolerans TaxID=2697043 RepID=A0A6P1MD55_9BACT|nr:fibronectin type III domain-containing protein [Tichowtungia aerotolerans]QHI69526.1 hypothetical protein GT409_08675 [Tichowtungia aerotolerans]
MKYSSLLSTLCACLFGAISSANAQAAFSKVFSPDTIGPDNHSTLTFTIGNGSSVPARELAFTDILPPGVIIASPANALIDGGEGTLSAPDGGSAIVFSDGKVSAFSSCTISVNVTSSTPGTHSSVSGVLTSSQGSSGTASDDLTVSTSRPGFSKSFSPASVGYGGRITLTYTIDNTLNASVVGTVTFSDHLPNGMVIADPANAWTDCVNTTSPNTTITAVPGTDMISLAALGNTFAGFEVLPAGAVRTVTVDVVPESIGSLVSSGPEMLADYSSVGLAGTTLNVAEDQLILKESFLNDPVSPGSTNASLEFTIINRSRSATATQISFTNDLNVTLSGLIASGSMLTDICGPGSTLDVGSQIVLSGGTLGSGETRSFRVPLQVPVSATSRAYTNATSPVTGWMDGVKVSGTAARDSLFISSAPVFTKEFIDDPTTGGGTVTLRYTLTNQDPSASVTNIAFTDDIGGNMINREGAIPGMAAKSLVAEDGLSPAPLTDICGPGSMLTITDPNDSLPSPPYPNLPPDPTLLMFSGGSLAPAGQPGDSCSFDVVLDIPSGLPSGEYISTTSELTASPENGAAASDALVVISAPMLTKEFIGDPVAPGGTVTLQYTLSYPEEATAPATEITFTDDLNTALAGLAANLPVIPDPPCGAGSSLSGSAGNTLLTLNNGTLSPGESRTFQVTLNIPAGASAGSFVSSTSLVAANIAGMATTASTASDDLTISSLIFTKEFLDDPLIAGETGTLRYVIQNVHPAEDAAINSFSDDLSSALSGLAVAGAVTQDSCGGTLSGTTTLTYIGGNVPHGQTAVIDVPVAVPVGAGDGAYRSVSGLLSATQAGASVTAGPATDVLEVNSSRLLLTLNIRDDLVKPGDETVFELTLKNLDASRTASNIGFSVDLDHVISGMTFGQILFNEIQGGLSVGGASLMTVSGASLAAGASANVRLIATVPANTANGNYSFTSSILTGSIDGLDVRGSAAGDTLEVLQLLPFSQSFDGPTVAGGSATLTFSLSNPWTNTVSALRFSEDLDSIMTGLVAVTLPESPLGEGSVMSGTSFLTLTGGELSPGENVTFDVEVQVPANAAAGTYFASTSDLTANGLTRSDPATANLVIEPPPTFSKTFSPDSVAYGETSTLTFTIDNTASVLDAIGLDFTDNLPAGLVVASPANASTTLTGGTLTAVQGSGSISYTGGSVAAGTSGIVQVDVTATAVGSFINTSGSLTSSSGNSGTATDTLTVVKADQTISFPSLGTQAVTNQIGLAATATSGLGVNFAVISGPASISSGTNLSFSSAGTVSLRASQSGDGNWNAAAITNTFDVLGVITNVAPDSGTVFGGTEVVIDGLWLGNGSDITNVTLCGISAAIVSQSVHSVTVSSSVAPPVQTNGNVVVESGFGSVVLTNGYTYRPVPLPPTARSAVDITDSQFVARWKSNDETATHYFVDVAESTNFTAMTGIYTNWNAGGNTACLVTGLVDGVTYWYRVRAANLYGSSFDSNLIEVPVSTNTPYVKQEITNGLVSAGSGDELELSDLFHGTDKSYQIISNSNPALVSAALDENSGTLTFVYTAGMSGTALITIREWTETDYTGFYVDNTIQLVVTDDQPAWSAGAVTFNLGNGLFEQVVSVTNTSGNTAQSVTLTVSNITDGATLYNATGTDSDGNAEIHWVGTLAGGVAMDFTLQYYTAAMGVTPTGTVSVSLSLEHPDVVLDEANEITLIGTVESGSTFVIAFNAEIGATYYVQYAETPAGPWKTAYPPITALTEQVQWVDSGPPVTEPAGSSRVYRVIKAD